ncbi:DNA primase large subunit [Balamuthia mandrillaris]
MEPITRKKADGGQAAYVPSKGKLLSLYKLPPTDDSISLETLDTYCYHRLRVLREIDDMRAKGLQGAAFSNLLHSTLCRLLPLNSAEAQKKDLISHFTLRFAYCKPDDRKWFIRQEKELFRHRLQKCMLDKDVHSFMEANNLQYETISAEEYTTYKPLLDALMLSNKSANQYHSSKQQQPLDSEMKEEPSASQFYKIPFERACTLVAARKVLMRRGFAYLHASDLVAIIISEFEAIVAEGLERAFKAFPLVASDERISPLLENLSKRYTGKDWSTVKGNIPVTIDQLDTLAERSFPLCMRTMHEALRKKHHVKHGTRMQYGLFLKGIGLSMEDALAFWRSEFTRLMSADKWEKEHGYTIRHNYGKEGKRTSYTPYSCVKIIASAPGYEDDHGCPFRHFDKDKLVRTLRESKVDAAHIDYILNEVEAARWGHACRLYFEAKHNNYQMQDLVINHPQQYFFHSTRYFKSSLDNGNGNSNSSNNTTPPQPQKEKEKEKEVEEEEMMMEM